MSSVIGKIFILIIFMIFLLNDGVGAPPGPPGWDRTWEPPSSSQSSAVNYYSNVQIGQITGHNTQMGQIASHNTQLTHPSNGPNPGNIPTFQPLASSETNIAYLYHGQNPTYEDLRRIGGDFPREYGMKYYILYNDLWSDQPTAYWYNQKTNFFIYNISPQHIWSYERYPNGKEYWQDLGYWDQGFHSGIFSADAKGWHQLAIYGSRSGWSNVLWINVL